MNALPIVLLLLLSSLTAARASDPAAAIAAVENAARVSNLTAERVLYAAEQALEQAALVIAAVDSPRLVHDELRRIAASVPGVRAIIVVGADGQLQHDSYRYPADPIDLSDRPYVDAALRRSGKTVVGSTVVGRTSGASFVPIARRINGRTFVAVAQPYALLDIDRSCADCWSLIANGAHEALAVWPPEREVLPTIVTVAMNLSRSGSTVVRYANSVVAVAWVRSERFGVTSIAIRGLPEATTDIDVN